MCKLARQMAEETVRSAQMTQTSYRDTVAVEPGELAVDPVN
jgi:hypothetical protein